MKRRHHTPEQVIRKLNEGRRLLAEGTSVDEVARHLRGHPRRLWGRCRLVGCGPSPTGLVQAPPG